MKLTNQQIDALPIDELNKFCASLLGWRPAQFGGEPCWNDEKTNSYLMPYRSLTSDLNLAITLVSHLEDCNFGLAIQKIPNKDYHVCFFPMPESEQGLEITGLWPSISYNLAEAICRAVYRTINDL